MFASLSFSKRKQKTIILKNIIQELNISDPEKDLYILSLDILDENDFEEFYTKITKNFDEESLIQFSIEPLSSKLI